MNRQLIPWLICAWLAFVLAMTFMENRVANAELRTLNGIIEAQDREIQQLKTAPRRGCTTSTPYEEQ